MKHPDTENSSRVYVSCSPLSAFAVSFCQSALICVSCGLFLTAADSMAAGTYTGKHAQSVMEHMVLINWNGDIGDTLGMGVYNQDLPEIGTVFRISTKNYNIPGDSLIVSSPAPEISPTLPNRIRLFKNFPNPFNSSTTIKFDIDRPALVKIEIFDILGRRIKTLINERRQRGFYEQQWHGSSDSGISVGSGVYFYRLTVDGVVLDTRKMLLIR